MFDEWKEDGPVELPFEREFLSSISKKGVKPMSSNEKIESRAISLLRNIIDKHPTMDHHFQEKDKDMCWDGFIRLYISDNEGQNKKSYDDDVDVQVKGHEVKKLNNRDKIKVQVNLNDLRVYFRKRGCLYFQVYMKENSSSSEVYYCSLHPVKIDYYLKKAMSQNRKEKIGVHFVKLDQSPKKLYDISKQFSNEVRKQGSGLGQIVSQKIDIGNVLDYSNLSVETTPGASTKDIIQGISTGDVTIYLRKGAIDIPLEWSGQIVSAYRKKVFLPIGVSNDEFYSSYEAEQIVNGLEDDNFSLQGKYNLHLSQNITILDIGGQFRFEFQFISDIPTIAHDAEFLLRVLSNKQFYIGEHTINIHRATPSPQLIHDLKGIIEVNKTLEESEIKISTPFSELSRECKTQLDLLTQIKHGDRLFDTEENHFAYCWDYNGKQMPLYITIDENGVHIVNIAFSNKLKFTYNDKDYGTDFSIKPLHEHSNIVPNYIGFSIDTLANLCYYNIDAMKEQIDRTYICDYTEGALLRLALNLIAAYDINCFSPLLDISNYLLCKLNSIFPNHYEIQINMIQIEKRQKGVLSDSSIITINKLKSLCEAQTDTDILKPLEYCISILLEDFDYANSLYLRMNEDLRSIVDGSPIQKLLDIE